MADNPQQSKGTAKKWAIRLALGCFATPAILLLLAIVAAIVWYQSFKYRGLSAVKSEIAKVRATDRPLTTVDLQASYLPQADREDVTGEILAAIAVYDDPDVRAQTKRLPIVGGVATAPSPGQYWPELTEVEAFLSTTADTVRFLESLPARNPTACFPIQLTDGLSTNLDHLKDMRWAVRSNSLQVHVDLHRGRNGDAPKRPLQQIALVQCIENEPTLVSQLTRLAILGVAAKETEEVLRHTSPTDEALLRLQMAVRQIDFRRGLVIALEGERAMGYTVTICRPSAIKDGVFTAEQIEEFAQSMPSRPADAALLLSWFRRYLEACEVSTAEAMREANLIETERKQLMQTPLKIMYVQTFLLVPAMQEVIAAFARMEAQYNSMDAGLAAHRFRRAMGRWPATLDELVPDYLPAAPLDPFNGQPLLISRTDSEYKVYSVGEDLIDDGGKWTTTDRSDSGFIATWNTQESP